MKYVALRDFDTFKKGDSIPNDVVCDRLIRGRKIGPESGNEIKEIKEIKEVVETKVENESELVLLTEDSSDVEVKVTEELEESEAPEVSDEVSTVKSKRKK